MTNNETYEELALLMESTFRILDAMGKREEHSILTLEVSYLCLLVKGILVRTVSEEPKNKMNSKDRTKLANIQLLGAKQGIQDAVAIGFEDAIIDLTNEELDYVCTVTEIAPSNSEVRH